MARKNLLKGLTIPKGTDYSVEVEQDENTYGKFVALPFERGFGTTIGNSLRRVLLSSIQGYAVSGIRFVSYDKDGNAHQITSEFESIPGVKEDIVEIIANVKKMRLKIVNPDETSLVVFVDVKGACDLKAESFDKDGLEVINKDLHLMTLENDAHVEFEIQVDLGRGYVSQDINDKYKEQFGVLAIDAIYTPVTRVKYFVESTRVGQRSDYDKLILEVFTDGTITPKEAVSEGVYILQNYLKSFMNFNIEDVVEEVEEDTSSELQSILNMNIEDLELSVRPINCLKRVGIKTVRELVAKTEAELSEAKHFGVRSLEEIKECLNSLGLEFGMGKNVKAFKSDKK